MDIILGYGFDDIRFGMLESEIIAQLGFPDKKYESDYELNLQYFSIRSELSLCKDDARLDSIECSNPSMRIFDKLIINQNKNEVISFFCLKLDEKPAKEDYQTFEVYDFSDSSLSLHFEFNTLTSVKFGNFWDDNGEPIWRSLD